MITRLPPSGHSFLALLGLAFWLLPFDAALARPDGSFGTSCAGCHGDPVLSSSPANGQTLSFGQNGYTLVGSSSNADFRLKNNEALGHSGQGAALFGGGFSGSFPGTLAGSKFTPNGSLAIVGTFYGSAFTGYLTQQASESRTYTYTPTERKVDDSTLSFKPANGFSGTAPSVTVALKGQGVAPVISLAGSQFNAGNVRLGTSSSALSVVVSNTGDGNLSGLGGASNLKASLPSVSGIFSGATAVFNLPDAGSLATAYAFAPTSRGLATAKLDVSASNGSTDNRNSAQVLPLTLSGTGVGPSYHASIALNTTLSFGDIAGQGSKAISISNNTPDADLGALTRLTLLSYEFTGNDAGMFSLQGFAAGRTLDKNDALSLDVWFTASGASGPRSATLSLLTDEGAGLGLAGNKFSYGLTVTAVPEPSVFGMLLAGLGCIGLRLRRSSRTRRAT